MRITEININQSSVNGNFRLPVRLPISFTDKYKYINNLHSR